MKKNHFVEQRRLKNIERCKLNEIARKQYNRKYLLRASSTPAVNEIGQKNNNMNEPW